MEEERVPGGGMAKRFVKTMQSSKFLGTFYTVKLILQSLTALSKLF